MALAAQTTAENPFWEIVMLRRNFARIGSLLLLMGFAAPFAGAQTTPGSPTTAAPTAQPKQPRSSTKTINGTITAIDPAAKTLRLTPQEGGDPVVVLLREDSKFTKKSKAAQASDFAVNDKVVARLSFRATGGEVWLRNLWDEGSHQTYTREGREISVGTVAANTGDKLDIKRADGSVISFRVTDKTRVRKNGAAAEIKAFASGAAVAVQPRRLPAGALMASLVADTAAEVTAARLDALANWGGVVESVDADKNTLTLKRSDGAIRTVTVASTARVARGNTSMPLKDLTPGTSVRVHLVKATATSGPRTTDRITIARSKKADDK